VRASIPTTLLLRFMALAFYRRMVVLPLSPRWPMAAAR